MEICLFYIFVIILFKELTISYLEIACASFVMFYRQNVWVLFVYICVLCVLLRYFVAYVCLNLQEERKAFIYLVQ